MQIDFFHIYSCLFSALNRKKIPHDINIDISMVSHAFLFSFSSFHSFVGLCEKMRVLTCKASQTPRSISHHSLLSTILTSLIRATNDAVSNDRLRRMCYWRRILYLPRVNEVTWHETILQSCSIFVGRIIDQPVSIRNHEQRKFCCVIELLSN